MNLPTKNEYQTETDNIKVDIIVPVYRGLQETRACLESVLANPQSTKFELIVIDDYSPEAELSAWLEDMAGKNKFTLLKNLSNLGFVQTVNRGMKLHSDRDVILLNSDAIVANDWLDRLLNCAYRDARIATVTPFSNNATICSYPKFNEDNELPIDLNLATLDSIFVHVNRGRYVEIPTGVGFCFYIKRVAINEIGFFDADAFEKGYGEENDFCQRAIKLGWTNVLAADVFVQHLGGVSFATEQNSSKAKATKMLATLHPNYEKDVYDFIGEDPILPFRVAIDFYRLLTNLSKIKGKDLLEACTKNAKQRKLPPSVESNDFLLKQLLAIEILFDILNNPSHKQAIEKAYGFSSDNFIALCDLSTREEREKLNKDIFELQTTILKREEQIAELKQGVFERDGYIATLQQWQEELRNEIEALRLSTSWRITKPLRDTSQRYQQIKQLIQLYQNHRWMYPGFDGFKRLIYQCVDAIQQSESKALRNKAPLDFIRPYLEKDSTLNPTILFDHDGGGGSNAYSHELVKIIHADGGVVLRVYCFENVWFVQWSADGMLFFTDSIEELFEVLSVSHSANIIINSLYGYPDIKVAAANIVTLTQTLKATLDFKIHDFYALCPSPHLSDFDDKYCGVPEDLDVCKQCLKKNLRWYHSWYPKENRPVDIVEWRRPFAELFEAATTITFFDPSSIEIASKAFYLNNSKIKVIPHVIKHFLCDKPIDITGSLHIGILGTLSHIKGGNVVKKLCEYIDDQGLDIPITVVGHSFVNTPSKVNIHGNYTPNDLPIIISKRGINVILMPSIIPETFSYTISEAMAMGLPIVAFDIGAQGNRVKQYALGKVVPLDSSPTVILAAIQSVLKIAQEKK